MQIYCWPRFPRATKCTSVLSRRMLMKPHAISTLQESSSLLVKTMTSGCSLRAKATSKPIVGRKEVEKKVRGQIDESLKTKTRAPIQSPQLQTKMKTLNLGQQSQQMNIPKAVEHGPCNTTQMMKTNLGPQLKSYQMKKMNQHLCKRCQKKSQI